MNPAIAAEDIANAVPRLATEVTTVDNDEGTIDLCGPPFKRGPLIRLWARLWRLPERVEVRLDEIGTYVVSRMDGRDLQHLCGDLAGHLQLSRREADAAVTAFLRLLLLRRLVVLDGWNEGGS